MDAPTPSPRALRVAMLIDRWEPSRGGAERAMAQLAEHLLARGHRVFAVAQQHASDAPGEHVRVSSFGWTRSQRERRLARALVGAAREHGADVIVGCRHLYECDLYWPHGGAHAVALSQARRARGERFERPPSGRHATFLEFERALLERGGARRVVCVSSMVRDELAIEWPACRERLVVIENGVDLERFRPELRATAGAALRRELGVVDGTPLLAFAARNPELKGLDTLLAALRQTAGEWRLLAAGFERARLGAMRDDARVLHRDFVDAAALWSAAELCVQPTWRDAGGLAILEALACGTPVITTRCDGSSETVAPHAGTVLERPGVIGPLASAIADWLARVRANAVDRTAIHACVAARDARTWLARLEEVVVALAH